LGDTCSRRGILDAIRRRGGCVGAGAAGNRNLRKRCSGTKFREEMLGEAVMKNQYSGGGIWKGGV